MANSFQLGIAVAEAMANAITTQFDGGTPPAVIYIYSGSAPTNADTALSGNTQLSHLAMSSVAFPASTQSTTNAVLTANAITNDTNASATGTATFFRVTQGAAGSAGTALCQGTVGTASCDMNLNTVSITSGSTVSITSATITVPEF